MNQESLSEWYYFSTPIYNVVVPDFLPTLKKVSDEKIKEFKSNNKIDEIYPMIQTDTFHEDERVSQFVESISQTGWDILNSQGYDMDNLSVFVGDMWVQCHYKYSSMDYHSHGYGSQLS